MVILDSSNIDLEKSKILHFLEGIVDGFGQKFQFASFDVFKQNSPGR